MLVSRFIWAFAPVWAPATVSSAHNCSLPEQALPRQGERQTRSCLSHLLGSARPAGCMHNSLSDAVRDLNAPEAFGEGEELRLCRKVAQAVADVGAGRGRPGELGDELGAAQPGAQMTRIEPHQLLQVLEGRRRTARPAARRGEVEARRTVPRVEPGGTLEMGLRHCALFEQRGAEVVAHPGVLRGELESLAVEGEGRHRVAAPRARRGQLDA